MSACNDILGIMRRHVELTDHPAPGRSHRERPSSELPGSLARIVREDEQAIHLIKGRLTDVRTNLGGAT
jgi:hypothetical protein